MQERVKSTGNTLCIPEYFRTLWLFFLYTNSFYIEHFQNCKMVLDIWLLWRKFSCKNGWKAQGILCVFPSIFARYGWKFTHKKQMDNAILQFKLKWQNRSKFCGLGRVGFPKALLLVANGAISLESTFSKVANLLHSIATESALQSSDSILSSGFPIQHLCYLILFCKQSFNRQ